MADRVLITGARSAAALDIARDFHALGWDVHMADCARARISRWSRAVTKLHTYPSPVRQPSEFRTRIRELADELQPRLIVPTCEEVFHLSAPGLHADISSRLFSPPLETLRTLHDKYAFNALGARIGLPVPESHILESNEALHAYAETSEDWVFKPCFSRFGEETMISPSAAELLQNTIQLDQPWIAQKRIRGTEASFYAVARNGKLTAFSAYASDWRLRGGASIAFLPATTRMCDSLLSIAERLAAHLNLSGQFACDAIFDETGTPWLIECNPRATSGVHFLADTGRLANAMLKDGPSCAMGRADSLYLLPAMATFGAMLALGRGKLPQWLQSLRDGRDVTGRPGDRLPALGALVDGSLYTLSGLRHGISASAATTADIEWNGGDF